MRADIAGGVTAALEATFSPSARGVAATIHRNAPMELRGPFKRHDEDLSLFLLRNVSAGVFGGDRYSVRLSTEPHARVRVTGTSATKVYRTPGPLAVSRVTIDIAAGSLLSYSPSPLILQAGSDISQTVDVRVASGGVAIASDIVIPGRLASGERMMFRRFRSGLRVVVNDNPELYAEQFTLDDSTSADAALGGYSVFGVLLAVGIDARLTTTSLSQSLSEIGDSYWGVSSLDAGALVVKVLSREACAVSRAIGIAEAEVLRNWRGRSAETSRYGNTVC